MTVSNEPPAPKPARPPASNVELLKALADPLRMNMMYVLTRNAGNGPPAMTVKEMAAALGEPQTKLYRHVKHLEAAGLIAAVSSRIVSGIVEQRYQARTKDLTGELTDSERASPEAEAMVAAAFETFRREYYLALRSGQLAPSSETSCAQRGLLAMTDGQVPASRATEIRAQLRALVDELSAEPDPDADDLVPVNLLIGYFSPDPSPSS